MTFGLMLAVMMTFVFGAIDMSRWLQARKMTMEAIDSAVLAGLKSYQSTTDGSAAIAAAQAEYNFNVQYRAPTTDGPGGPIAFQFVPGSNYTQMTATGNATMEMPVLQLARMPSLPLLKTDLSEHAISKVAAGSSTGTSLEVSVMIDITGSMGESDNAGSTKIETVKAAAATLVDLLIWSDQSQFTSKIAVIPFSETVNLGTAALADAARGSITWGATSTTPGSQGYTVRTGTNWRGNATYATFTSSTTCVTERTGMHAYDDTSPNVAPVGRHYSWDGSCPTSTAMVPLTSNTAALKSLIGGLTAGGGTAGQLGTAWAWYTLSPNFNGLWPSSSAARPYSDLTILNTSNKPILQKIAILMTDGDYNTQYCSGVGSWAISCNGDNGPSQTQAGLMCTAMKNKGIVVYTIGAQVSATAKAFLQTCATDPLHYYDATDGTKLRAAFIDIANQLVRPIITH